MVEKEAGHCSRPSGSRLEQLLQVQLLWQPLSTTAMHWQLPQVQVPQHLDLLAQRRRWPKGSGSRHWLPALVLDGMA